MYQRSVSSEKEDVRRLCAWCGSRLGESGRVTAITSRGICSHCARVLEGRSAGDQSLPSDGLVCSRIEEHANRLMCRLYESRQSLLDLQRQVRHDGALLVRVGQLLASIRDQERVVAEIQRCIAQP